MFVDMIAYRVAAPQLCLSNDCTTKGQEPGSTTLMPHTSRTLSISCIESSMISYCCGGAIVSVKLRPLTGPLSIPEMIRECMEHRRNDIDGI